MKNFYYILFIISTATFSQVNLDTNFGNQGKVTTHIGPDGEINGLAQQADGKIIASGVMFDPAGSPGNRYHMLLSRYNTDDTLDTTFGTNGSIDTNFGMVNYFRGNAVAIQSDGKIILGGSTEEGAPNNIVFAMTRYFADGTPDTNFGTNGVVTTDFNSIGGQTNGAQAMQIDANNKIILAGNGNSTLGADDNYALIRYNNNGSVDTTFGTAGKAEINIGNYLSGTFLMPSNDDVTAMKILPNGKILLAGRSDATAVGAGRYNLALVRLNADGTLDTSFGTNGIVVQDYGVRDMDFALAITPDNKSIVVGNSFTLNYENCKIIAAKFNYDGSPDTAFGTNGAVVSNLNTVDLNDGLKSVLLQSDGKILAGGFSMNGTSRDFLLMRMNSNGSLDTTFSPTGYITTDFGQPYDIAYAMLMQNDGKVVLAGETGDNYTDYALARYNLGTLAATGFESGQLTVSPNPVASLLTIKGMDENGQSVTIYNQLGQLVLKTDVADTIDVSNLVTGTYFIRITADHTSETIKFIKK